MLTSFRAGEEGLPPPEQPKRVMGEAEFGFVIGREVENVSETEAPTTTVTSRVVGGTGKLIIGLDHNYLVLYESPSDWGDQE